MGCTTAAATTAITAITITTAITMTTAITITAAITIVINPQAFESKDMQKLQECLQTMPIEEVKYHMKRCEDSGLWVK